MTVKEIYRNIKWYGAVMFAAALSIGVTSCGGDDDDSPAVPEERSRITFDKPIIKGISRTMYDYEQVIPYNTGENFRIFGVKYASGKGTNKIWKSAPEYNEAGETATYDDIEKGWDTELGHYWAEAALYAFRAYSPDDASLTGKARYDKDATGLKIDNYKLPAMGAQYDLMYSNAVYDVKGPTPAVGDGNPHYAGINLMFNHALASVHFYVTIHYDYIKKIDWELRPGAASKFKIKQITLNNVYDTGSFNENSNVKGKPDNRNHVAGTPAWTLTTTSKGSGYNFVGATPVANIPFNENDDVKDVSQDIKTINADAHIGFMIPQDLPADASVTITWMFDDIDQKPITVNLQKLTPTWEMGKRYKYIIKLSRDKFYFDPSVSDMGGPGDDITVQ